MFCALISAAVVIKKNAFRITVILEAFRRTGNKGRNEILKAEFYLSSPVEKSKCVQYRTAFKMGSFQDYATLTLSLFNGN